MHDLLHDSKSKVSYSEEGLKTHECEQCRNGLMHRNLVFYSKKAYFSICIYVVHISTGCCLSPRALKVIFIASSLVALWRGRNLVGKLP